MARPKSKEELLSQIDAGFADLIDQVEAIPPDQRAVPGVCEDWSVKDLLAHLDAWHELFLRWERTGAEGGKPDMPAPGYTWAETPSLNAQIHDQHRNDPYPDIVTRLDASRRAVRAVIAAYDADELFEKRRYPWTGSTSVGSYAASATSSHYAWALQLIRRFGRSLSTGT